MLHTTKANKTIQSPAKRLIHLRTIEVSASAATHFGEHASPSLIQETQTFSFIKSYRFGRVAQLRLFLVQQTRTETQSAYTFQVSFMHATSMFVQKL